MDFVFQLLATCQPINLKAHTGAEFLFYGCPGTSDLALRLMSFATECLEEFLTQVLNIDEQDFMAKMEGFALQCLTGIVYIF
jgi:hypothetical protein